MDEKKSIKVSLGTTICVFIIFFLIIAIVAMYYFGFIKNNEKISDLESQKGKLENGINLIKTEINEEKITQNEEKTIPKEEKNSKKTVTYKDIAGEYQARIELNDGTGESGFYSLDLLDNGKYKYEYGTFAPGGTIGSYIINDNEILLNMWFATGSDVRARVTSGTIKLTLNEDGTITDTNDVLKLNNSKSSEIILKKDTSYFNQNDLEEYMKNLLNGEGLMNAYGGVAGGKWSETEREVPLN